MFNNFENLFIEYNAAIVTSILGQNGFANYQVRHVYESSNVVNNYLPDNELQKPESAVLEELRDKLPEMRMLDIGVGAGRTTKFFAPLAKEYVGIDFSSNMIKACRLKYPSLTFEVGDARKLVHFNNQYFDFVMFSFNGIDNVEHEERLAILHEIRRVIRKNGIFCFSTLNLNAWRLKPPFRFSKNPAKLYRSTYNFILNHKVWENLKQKKNPQHMMAYYRYKDYLIRNYFITPSEQLKQLKDAGFSNTKVYDLNTGKLLSDPTETMDYWVYFLTEAK
jgi:ubiquinone/menaquinone biosynthesis C-methylase UbiE